VRSLSKSPGRSVYYNWKNERFIDFYVTEQEINEFSIATMKTALNTSNPVGKMLMIV